MTALEKIREFVRSYPGADIFREFQVDYTDQVPFNGGIFPSGLVEVDRSNDILGNATVINQYNFGLYYVFEKIPGDDVGAARKCRLGDGFPRMGAEAIRYRRCAGIRGCAKPGKNHRPERRAV